MKKTINLLFIFCLIAIPEIKAQLTPAQIMEKTVKQITASKGNESNFKLYYSGYSGTGTIKTAGSNFKVTLPDIEVWYNGKDLYTLNKNTLETTVITPSYEELAESNPMTYLTGAQKNYNITFSTVKKNDKYVLELTPKKKGNDIKRVTVTISKKNFLPDKIVVEPKGGSPITAEITSFKTNLTLSDKEFEFPKSKYTKVEVIDLR